MKSNESDGSAVTEHRTLVVIGTGQAGLATSYRLTDAGCDHVLDRHDRDRQNI